MILAGVKSVTLHDPKDFLLGVSAAQLPSPLSLSMPYFALPCLTAPSSCIISPIICCSQKRDPGRGQVGDPSRGQGRCAARPGSPVLSRRGRCGQEPRGGLQVRLTVSYKLLLLILTITKKMFVLLTTASRFSKITRWMRCTFRHIK